MVIIQAIILGLIQGLSEFIPISSSAHLIIIPWLFHWNDPALNSLVFDVALHVGTLIALLVFFASDWIRLIRAGIASIVQCKIGKDIDRRLAWFLVIGCIPGGMAGFLFESKIEVLFHSEPIRASAMIEMGVVIAFMGGLLFIAERFVQHIRKLEYLSFRDSILIGLAQALAIFPGVSRSGSTITAGLALGLERETAARFSFLLSAPIIAGAGMMSVFKILKLMQAGTIAQAEIILFPIGFITAALSGYFCIKFLLRYLQSNSTNIFVYYRWGFAALIIVAAFLRG